MLVHIVQFFEKKVLLFSIIAIIINLMISRTVLFIPYEGLNGKMFVRILSLALPTLIFIYGIKKIFCEWKFGFQKSRLIYGILIGWLMIVYSVLSFLSTFIEMPADRFIFPNILSFMLCIITDLMIGFREEVIIRGIVFNHMLNKWKGRKHYLLLSVLVSSVLFGLMHLVNLTNNPGLVNDTICQVIYATFIGIFLAAIYLKSKNIWSVIILHGLFDFADDIFKVITRSNPNLNTAVDSTLIDALLYSMIFLPLAIYGVVVVLLIKPVSDEKNEQTKNDNMLI